MKHTDDAFVCGSVRLAGDSSLDRPLHVDAHDVARLLPRPIASALTDERGRFEISFRRTAFSAIYGDKLPDLSFRIYRDGVLLRDTGDEVLWRAARPGQPVKIVVEYPVELEAQPVDQGERPGVVSVAVIRGRLGDSGGKPAANHRVIASRGSGEKAQRLGSDITDAEGSFAIAVDRAMFGKVKRWQVSFAILKPEGRPVRLERASRRVEIDADKPLVIELPADNHPRPPALPIETLTRLTGIDLTAKLRNTLEQAGIATLDDVRSKAEFRALLAQGAPADRQRLALLESQANLAGLNPDLTVNAALITAGYRSIGDIASAPADEFIAAAIPHTGPTEAARLHAVAGATSALLDGFVADAKLERAAGSRISTLPGVLDGLFPDQPDACGCKDCEAAVSPLAYLADLIAYAIEQVRADKQPITLDTFEEWTRQPLGALPAACSTVEDPVRQVRMAVEVLRRHLGSQPPQDEIRDRVEAYCEAAYQVLLSEAGCTLVDLLTTPVSDERARERVAMRLGISVNHLDGLKLAAGQRTEGKLEALFGLAGTQPDRDPLKPVPPSSLEEWRLEFIESVWLDQDHPRDPWAASEPRIDPDLIGPDDFRVPRETVPPSNTKQAFDLWVRRREWVDAQFRALSDQRPMHVVRVSNVPNLTAMLESMETELDYYGTTLTPWPESTIQVDDFPGWARTLRTGNNEADVEALRQEIQEDVHLDEQAFLMLVDLWEKDQRWIAHDRNPRLTEDDWHTIASVLTQARKAAFREVWHQEEVDAAIRFDPHTFWISLTEPKDGAWPPPTGDAPLIDPERVAWADLPDMEAGAAAQELYTTRRKQISDIRDELSATLRDDGFQALLDLALGNPPALDLDVLRNDLSGLDETKATKARDDIEKLWQMSVDDFDRLTVVGRKVSGQQPGDSMPTDVEWADVLRILTTAKKVGDFYPSAQAQPGIWRPEEQATIPSYWEALKAKIPAWRASPQRRALWQQSLRQRYQSALIDPDVIVAGDFRRLSPHSYRLWSTRKRNLQTLQEQLTNDHTTAANPLTGLTAMCSRVFKRDAQFLIDLQKVLSNGHDIGPRLAQLNLTPAEFDTLLQIRRLADAGEAVPDEYWKKAEAALVLVSKRRDAALWRDEELSEKVFLSPSDFKPTNPAPNDFFLPAAGSRRNLQARREWQDVIEARAEQRRSVVEGLRTMVGAVEATQLPPLRDALIELSDAQGGSLSKARWLAARLFIDLEIAGCDLTTRAAQATTTLQTLISGIRAGLTKAVAPSLKCIDPHFDERWKWLGSYATWRAAMFVQLYPENILVPSLRRDMSEGFEMLVHNLRQSQRMLDPDFARRLGAGYADHYRDIGALKIEVSCHVGDDTDSTREVAYWFAMVPGTGRCYWSRCGFTAGAFEHQHWRRISVLDGSNDRVQRLVAAVPVRPLNGDRSILLFVQLSDGKQSKLALLRLNPANQRFEDRVQELSLPDETTNFTAEVMGDSRPSQLVVVFVHDRARNKVYWNRLDIFAKALMLDTWPVLISFPGVLEVEWPDWASSLGPSQIVADFLLRAVLKLNQQEGTEFALFFEQTTGGGGSSVIVYRRFSIDVTHLLQDNSDANTSWRVLDTGSFAGYFYWAGSGYVTWTRRNGQAGQPPGKYCLRLRPYLNEIPRPVQELQLDGLHWMSRDFGATEGQYTHLLAFGNEEGVFIGQFRIALNRTQLDITSRWRVSPSDSTAEEIAPARGTQSSLDRQDVTASLLRLHEREPRTVKSYVWERYYFAPIAIAAALQQNGHYQEALDWYRTVYDDRLSADPVSTRKVWHGLIEEESLASSFRDLEDWLLDPLNPHAIAARRANTYTRFTLLSIIRCLLAYADHEFTIDTPKSVSLARQLYQRVLVLLNLPELRIEINGCDKLIGEIDIRLGDDEYRDAVRAWISGLSDVGDLSRLKDAVESIKGTLVDASIGQDARLVKLSEEVDKALAGKRAFRNLADVVSLRSSHRVGAQNRLLANERVTALVRDLDAAVGQTMPEVAPTFPTNRAMGGDATVAGGAATTGVAAAAAPGTGTGIQRVSIAGKSLTGYREFVPGVVHQFCVPPNPIIGALRLRAEMNLFKANNCRNIAGVERQLEPYEAATDTTTGLPSIGPGGDLVVPGLRAMAPTPHRFPVLIERARQLAQTAWQMESAMLSALQQLDNERHSRLKARQDLKLSRAGVQLQELRLIEAEGSVALAELQQERAQFGLEHYEDLLSDGLSQLERDASTAMALSVGLHMLAAVSSFLSLSGFFSSSAAAASQVGSLLSTYASYERRRQEWEFQRGLGQFDVRISGQQVRNARGSLRTVGQERNIAGIQADHAQATLDFLDNKFGTAELYDWMSGVLEDVYSYFLFQATTVAKQASAQLAFTRQQPPPPYIQDDYWSAPSSSGFGGAEPDRRGLTGSARLLQDITQLEQFALDNEKRNQNLEKTFSLARMAPAEFQRFRESGVMVFATPMELFDRDFPGHYLRLIKRVRLSIPALIPPVEGIRATLTSGRLSRVVIGGDIFQTVRVQQGPEQVAYTSARNASGVFELDPQPTLLLPFEGIGVDTQWQLQLPKAANHFDFGSIADALITIEYTALNDFNYRQHVIHGLSSSVSAERAFSFRRDFPDQWYDLHHPEATDRPMTVRFDTRRADFPVNLDALGIDSVALLVARSTGASFELQVRDLRFSEVGAAGEVGGVGEINREAETIDGIISTRRSNAASWLQMFERRSPVGDWELSLPNTAVVRGRFARAEIEDLLLVIAFSARTPQWPP